MSVIYIVFPLAGLMSLLALYAYMRAVRTGQFDDADTPAQLPLIDDAPERRPSRPPHSAAAPPQSARSVAPSQAGAPMPPASPAQRALGAHDAVRS